MCNLITSILVIGFFTLNDIIQFIELLFIVNYELRINIEQN